MPLHTSKHSSASAHMVHRPQHGTARHRENECLLCYRRSFKPFRGFIEKKMNYYLRLEVRKIGAIGRKYALNACRILVETSFVIYEPVYSLFTLRIANGKPRE